MKMESKTPAVASRRIIVKVERALMSDLHSLVEEVDHLAIVRTLDPDLGIVELIATEDTYADALKLCTYFVESLNAEILSRG
ncbi:MAG: DUF4911 domain-containing protein [Nitrospinota bacterium]|nr:DUF4911 domain-containing protein [Nitrospinota bacterium]